MTEEKQPERWNWKKLAKGPFTGINYGKAITLTICQVIIIVIVGSIIFCIFAFVKGHIPNTRQDTRIEGNTGVINQHDNHATATENHWHLPLSDLFSFGSKGKKVADGE